MDWWFGDLQDISLNTLVAGMDAVVHLAALVHQPQARSPLSDAAYQRENVELTRRLMEAALTAGVLPEHFVFSSSVSVYGRDGDFHGDESSLLQPIDAYSRSKQSAEALVRQAGGVILRFPVVYGAGDRGNIARMARAIQAGWFLLPSTHCGRRSILAADNAGAAIQRVLESPLPARSLNNRIWIVCDQRTVRVDELAQVIARCANVAAPHQVPDGLLKAMAAAGDLATRIGISSPFTGRHLRKLNTDLSFSSACIRNELGYRDVVTLEQGVRDMLKAM